jgi:hypothetical protein
MKASTKATILRVAIPVLRLLPAYAAVYGFAVLHDLGVKAFIAYAPPLQKVFYAPIMLFVWGGLALAPFVLLRNNVAFRLYVALFLGCLGFMAYDYLVPFRYVAPGFRGAVSDAGGGFSRAGEIDRVDYWISYPAFPPNEDDMWMLVVRVTPLALAFVYRRSYRLWTARDQRPAR